LEEEENKELFSSFFIIALDLTSIRYILTGAPGSGKTTLIDLLGKTFCTFKEHAAQLITDGFNAPINIESQSDSFGERVLNQRIKDYQASSECGVSFFDRGIPDGLGYSYFMSKKPSNELLEAINLYRYDHILLFKPWKKIYSTTPVRREDFQTSVKIYDKIVRAYQDSGYLLNEIPSEEIPERLEFIEHFISNTKNLKNP
jgi:predicted ATPase